MRTELKQMWEYSEGLPGLQRLVAAVNVVIGMGNLSLREWGFFDGALSHRVDRAKRDNYLADIAMANRALFSEPTEVDWHS